MSQFSAVGACECDDVDNFIQPHFIAGKSWRNPVLNLANDEEMQNGNCRLPCLEHFERYARKSIVVPNLPNTHASHLSQTHTMPALCSDKTRWIEKSFLHRHFDAVQQNERFYWWAHYAINQLAAHWKIYNNFGITSLLGHFSMDESVKRGRRTSKWNKINLSRINYVKSPNKSRKFCSRI